MCGFAGVLARGDTARPLGPLAEGMAAALVHRGPDDAGLWADEDAGVALGFRRLAILDRSPAGRQPMVSASGRWVIALNGEIYNFRELWAELEAAGRAPLRRGGSDTEALLAAVEAWGPIAAVRRAIGMFAIALWDRRERRLHLIRDRLGIKPLYVGRARGALVFGSELRALRRHPGLDGTVDRDALGALVRFGYVPGPGTILRHVSKLSPGTALIVSADGAERTELYWSLEEAVAAGRRAPFRGGPEEAVDELERVLADAVRLRRIADVPLGVFLSGGIDSTAVTALLAGESSRPVRTFTIAVEGEGYDESAHAARIAAHLGTEHTALRVSDGDARALVPRLGALCDQPLADASQIPTHLVAALARPHVTVALAGDGGDELFGGYERYRWLERLWRRLGPVPAPARWALARGLEAAPPRLCAAAARLLPPRYRLRSPGEKAERLAAIARCASPEGMYVELVSMTRAPERLVPGAAPLDPIGQRLAGAAAPEGLRERLMYADAGTYLPDDILAKVDAATMAASLEARVPLLDHRVVELAWRLPVEIKVRDGRAKWPLVELVRRRVPPALVERPKHGFSVPVAAWLRGALAEWAGDLLAEGRLRRGGLFDARAVAGLWDEHRSGRRDAHWVLWNVLAFEAWREAGAGEEGRAAAAAA